ncbi:MAG: hypothetical protein G5663_06585 [Serratia symbiotica]|nr:hypothetical protein [Serratia symbiotica]
MKLCQLLCMHPPISEVALADAGEPLFSGICASNNEDDDSEAAPIIVHAYADKR